MPGVSNRIDHILREHHMSKLDAVGNHILLIVETNLAILALILIGFTALIGIFALVAYLTNLCTQVRNVGRSRQNHTPRGRGEFASLEAGPERGAVSSPSSEYSGTTSTLASTHSTAPSSRPIPIPRRVGQYGPYGAGQPPSRFARAQRYNNDAVTQEAESWGTVWSE